MSYHDELGLGDVHQLHNWEYADAAARTGASGFTAADVDKVAKQLDTDTLWRLTSTAPTWKQVDGGAGGGVTDHGALTGLGDDDHGQYLRTDGTRQLTGDQDVGGNDLTGIETATFGAEHDNGSQAAGWTLDWNNGQKQRVTLTGSGAVTITNPQGVGSFLLKVITTGNFSPTWPASVLWPNGSPPSLSNNGTDLLSFYWDGTNYFGEGGGQNYS